MSVEADLRVWTTVLGVTALYLLVRHWRSARGAGLIVAYVLSFVALHWLATTAYLFPWYWTPKAALSVLGLRQSAFALLAFAAGAEVAAALARRRTAEDVPAEEGGPVDPRVVTLCLVGGIAVYVLILPIASLIPSATAVAGAASTLLVIGLALRCWNGWFLGRRSTVAFWLGVTSCLPFATVVTQGFLGYGFGAAVLVFAFVASLKRPGLKEVALGVLLAYLGLSVYVTYMRDRTDIRNVVWAGAGFGDRVDQVLTTIGSSEWFDPYSPDHLDRIDRRLNQDYLVGSAVAYIQEGRATFAHGTTMWEAVIALIPRAVWPDKPVTAGSGDLVSRYTGIGFMEGTSVGIGQVMEFYVNFGTSGVVAGFALIGLLVVSADRAARRALDRGDVVRFTLCFLPALSLLQLGGSLVEVTSTAGAGVLGAVILRQFVGHLKGPMVPVHPVLASEPATLDDSGGDR